MGLTNYCIVAKFQERDMSGRLEYNDVAQIHRTDVSESLSPRRWYLSLQEHAYDMNLFQYTIVY